jgi:hypothetical protein
MYVKRSIFLVIFILLIAASSCGPSRKKALSFDEIRDRIKGKTAAEALEVLGEPDSRQKMLLFSERWIWWNYTYLKGKNYPPELRGKKVHLEIIFDRSEPAPGNSNPPPSKLRATDSLQITYTLAKEDQKGDADDDRGR